MSYKNKFRDSQAKSREHAIATKILDLMNELRMGGDENSERRWIWELLQNAKDVAFEEIGISIEINIENYENEEGGEISIRHNGKPFSVDNITFLIEQVSTKERTHEDGEKPKSTGKFGTGFLTTHLLSEKVHLEGVVKEPDEPYRKFNLVLDRSGDELLEIIDSVKCSMGTLDSLDEQTTYDVKDNGGIWTKFKYILDKDGLEVAERGISDLYSLLPYVFAFIPEIKKVTLIHDNISYSVSEWEEIVDKDGLEIVTVSKVTQGLEEEIKIALICGEKAQIAIEVEQEDECFFCKSLSETTPRLFCDFPLVGSEVFGFPTIINSSYYNPNDPRSGAFMTAKENKKVLENKLITEEAIDLFSELLTYASENNWKNLFALATMPDTHEVKWLSIDWYNKHVKEPLRKTILHSPIVDTYRKGRIPIEAENESVDFPYHSKREIREKIWTLCSKGSHFILPVFEHIHEWKDLIWTKKHKLTIDSLSGFIESQKDLTSLGETLELNAKETIDWLNEYFELITLDEQALNRIRHNEVAVIPNQNGRFCLNEKLNIDKNIEEPFKDIMSALDKDWRNLLVHKEIFTGDKISFQSKTEDDIISEINKSIKEASGDSLQIACDLLICLMPKGSDERKERLRLYNYCKLVFPDDISQTQTINSSSSTIWEEADKNQINWLISAISEESNVKALQEKLSHNSHKETIEWLNDFIGFLVESGRESKLNLKNTPILPNQNGEFRVKDNLFLDDGEIDETIKDIAADLGHDFRDELLDIDIYIELPENRTYNKQFVADEISTLIRPRINEIPRSDETKKLCRKLYLWFNANKDLAKLIFTELYEHKHRLYDDEEIAENMEKAEKISDIMDEFEIDNIEEIREALRHRRKTQNREEDKTPITQEVLVSLGITSIEDLNTALADNSISDRFIHVSTPSYEMLKYVKDLIERVKENVRNYLEQQPEYDCSDWEEVAPTVVAGVTKRGRDIHLVLRPSDNNQVIFYGSSERDTLSSPDAELWVEDGISSPQIITLGTVLKKTGITRFDL